MSISAATIGRREAGRAQGASRLRVSAAVASYAADQVTALAPEAATAAALEAASELERAAGALRRLFRASAESRQAVAARMLRLGYPPAVIAARLRVNERTARRWRANHAAGRPLGYHPEHHADAP